MIEVKNIYKKYKNITLFESVNTRFEDGKKILIKGVNGAGKSVFLKMLVGYSKPDYGEIIVDDYKIGVDIEIKAKTSKDKKEIENWIKKSRL